MSYLIPVDNNDVPVIKQDTSIQKYKDLPSSIDAVDKPDNRDLLVAAYGDQLIGGPSSLCDLVGATTTQSFNDQVTWWEEARLHKTQDGTIASTSPGDSGAKTITTNINHTIIDGDAVMINGNIRAFAQSTGNNTYTVTPVKGSWGTTFAANEAVTVFKTHNEWAQGTDQPDAFEQSNVTEYNNKHIISKWTYRATGSQMGNKSWVRDSETGEYFWYLKSVEDQKKRILNYHESMYLFAQEIDNTNLLDLNLNGSVGYTEAIEKGGIVHEGYLEDINDLRKLCRILVKQNGAKEYMVFANQTQLDYLDEMVAAAAGGNTGPSYGSFPNSQELGLDSKGMAVQLGYRSVKVSGHTFHFKSIDVLNDPKFAGNSEYYKFFMVPMDTMPDAKTSIQAPLLEKNVKGYPDSGQLRYMERWMEGGANGIYTNGMDENKFNWRTEACLVTRAANRHVVGLG